MVFLGISEIRKKSAIVVDPLRYQSLLIRELFFYVRKRVFHSYFYWVFELDPELSLDLFDQSFKQKSSFLKWVEVDIDDFFVETAKEADHELHVELQDISLDGNIPVEVIDHCIFIDILSFRIGSL